MENFIHPVVGGIFITWDSKWDFVWICSTEQRHIKYNNIMYHIAVISSQFTKYLLQQNKDKLATRVETALLNFIGFVKQYLLFESSLVEDHYFIISNDSLSSDKIF